MAKLMQKKYVNFISNGNPNGGEDLRWPRYEETPLKYRSVVKFGDLILGNFSSVIGSDETFSMRSLAGRSIQRARRRRDAEGARS